MGKPCSLDVTTSCTWCDQNFRYDNDYDDDDDDDEDDYYFYYFYLFYFYYFYYYFYSYLLKVSWARRW